MSEWINLLSLYSCRMKLQPKEPTSKTEKTGCIWRYLQWYKYVNHGTEKQNDYISAKNWVDKNKEISDLESLKIDRKIRTFWD